MRWFIALISALTLCGCGPRTVPGGELGCQVVKLSVPGEVLCIAECAGFRGHSGYMNGVQVPCSWFGQSVTRETPPD